MTIEPDPKPDSIDDSDEGFAKHFNEFASGDTKPDPDSEKGKNEAKPDGNGPAEDEPSAPEKEGEAEEKSEGEPDKEAADGEEEAEEATSGEGAEKPDGSQPSEEQAPDDEWASLPDELKAKVEQLRKEKDEAVHRASSDANRVAALSRKLHQLQIAGQPSGEPRSEQQTEAQKALDGKIKQLKEDYPEVAEPLIELLEAQKKELTTVRTQLEGLSEVQQAQVIATETQALDAKHPDWRQVAQSTDFAGWLGVQPENIQRLANSWDARETSVVLTLFKAERMETTGQTQTGKPPEKKPEAEQKPKPDAATGERRSQQLDGGRDVRSKPAPAASGPPEDFESAFQYFTEKRRLAASRK